MAKKIAAPAKADIVDEPVSDAVECTHYVKILDRIGPPLAVLEGIRPACVQFYYHYQFTNEDDALAFAEKFEARYSHMAASVHESKKPFVYHPSRDPWQGKYDAS